MYIYYYKQINSIQINSKQTSIDYRFHGDTDSSNQIDTLAASSVETRVPLVARFVILASVAVETQWTRTRKRPTRNGIVNM